jgi:septin family protein
VHRKSVKKGFEFTVLVVGESGTGRMSLINCLFKTNIHSGTERKSKKNGKVEMVTHTVEIEERGVKLKLTVVDAAGFGDGLDCTKDCEPIAQYIDRQFEKYFDYENGLNRRQIQDTRVHCCFYFISPDNWSLKPLDVLLMKSLHRKVNIIPLIAKADMLTPSERDEMKKRILKDIQSHEIALYSIPEDFDEDSDYRDSVSQLKAAMPFAVSASLKTEEIRGRSVSVRAYPWGTHEVENGDHSDFVRLKSLLVTNMQDLREVTHEVHYENFRAQRMGGKNFVSSSTIMETSIDDDDNASERERILLAKEQEIKRMAEMLRMYEEKLQQQKQLSHQTNIQ